ncbi:hypothetical protein LJC46_04625 [Desulfovibrio sp. OttesenSCG-928-G15]|nr:hypothetical protein [Desulfovibrio sp. OttesenSCG-928-G15]
MSNKDAEAFTLAATAELEKVKGDIVSQTLSNLNKTGGKKGKKSKGGFTSMNDTFNLSKNILSAAYEGKGTIIDSSR